MEKRLKRGFERAVYRGILARVNRDSEGACLMPILKVKRIQRESFAVRAMKFIATTVGVLWSICLQLTLSVSILFACALLFLAIIARSGHLALLAVGFALAAAVLRFSPILLAKIRRRFREKINEQNR
jgi:hypothetical protein